MTADRKKFSLLRTILRALGLSPEAIDDVIERILDFLSVKDDSASPPAYPYAVRDDFLSPAEQNFFLVLKVAVADSAIVCPKVTLGDLFYARVSDPSQYRTYTNKIDRKHVDFLLCDPQTLRPRTGLELDDASHQRSDRQARDVFVERVFAAANIPLVRVPVRRSYSVSEVRALIDPHLVTPDVTSSRSEAPSAQRSAPPPCPKCGVEMILRTPNPGSTYKEPFWGCVHFPRCRSIVQYTAPRQSRS